MRNPINPSNLIYKFYAKQKKPQAAFNTTITESPLKNILLTNLSLGTGLPFLPLEFLGVSVHSLTKIVSILTLTQYFKTFTYFFDIFQH